MPADHYFTEQPSARGRRELMTVELRGFSIRLVTVPGVFSRERIDRGTRLLIKHIEISPTDRVLDLGCGYGAVGIVSALLASEGRVTLTDVNRAAAEAARENLHLNQIENAEVVQGPGFDPIPGFRFDVIALNPPIRAGLRVVRALLEEAVEHLSPGGRFWLVGRTKQGVVRLSENMSRAIGETVEVAKGGGYRLYTARCPNGEGA